MGKIHRHTWQRSFPNSVTVSTCAYICMCVCMCVLGELVEIGSKLYQASRSRKCMLGKHDTESGDEAGEKAHAKRALAWDILRTDASPLDAFWGGVKMRISLPRWWSTWFEISWSFSPPESCIQQQRSILCTRTECSTLRHQRQHKQWFRQKLSRTFDC